MKDLDEQNKKLKREIKKLGKSYRPRIVNRDINAALNIRLTAIHILKGEEEPKYMQRSRREEKNETQLENVETRSS